MADRAWKAHERRAGALINGRRYPANLGGSVDVESTWAVGQAKEVRRLSLAAAMFREMSGSLPGEPTGPEPA